MMPSVIRKNINSASFVPSVNIDAKDIHLGWKYMFPNESIKLQFYLQSSKVLDAGVTGVLNSITSAMPQIFVK